MRKIVKLILISLLVLSLAQTGSAFSGAGAGTEADKYIITDVNQLQEMQGGLNAWYKLGNAIDASATIHWNGGQGFVPIGDSAHGFAGNFDGRGFSITGLCINRAGSDNVGLFGAIRIATVMNVTLVNPTVNGNSSTGSLVGYSDSSTISDCSCTNATVKNAINASNVNAVGGLVGNSNNSTITDCSCSGATVQGAGNVSYVGGLVGNKTGGTINGCWASQPVVTFIGTNAYYFGGLLGGQSGGSLLNCKCYTARVSGGSSTGGLVGSCSSANIDNSFAEDAVVIGSDSCGGLVGNYSSSVNLTNSHSSGTVTGTSNVGGLVGTCAGYYVATINNCYSQANVTGTGDSVGGLVGYQVAGTTVTGCNATGKVAGNNYVGGLVGDSAYNNWYGGCSLTKCYATGNVQGFSQVGGLVGRNEQSSISKSYSSGSIVTGNNYVGGCVGYNSGTIFRCFSTSDANAGAVDCGGFVGKSDSSITDCFATGKAGGSNFVGGFAGETGNSSNTATCYSTGFVKPSPNFGGFAGYNSGSATACFWDVETSGVGVTGCGTRMTTKQMMQKSTFAASWNFATIWGIDEGTSYPYIMELSPVAGDPWHPYPTGDLDYDGHVNFSDFAIFAENWLACTAPECDVARPGAFTLALAPECGGTNAQIRLNWAPALGANTYDVYRGGTLYHSDVVGTQFIDTTVSAGSSYTYFVRAKNASGTADCAPQSAIAPADCGATPPGAFTLALAPECGGSSPHIRLNWSASSRVSTYDVYRDGTLYYSNVTGTQFVNNSIIADSNYTYFVRAKNAVGTTDTTSESATAPTCSGETVELTGVPYIHQVYDTADEFAADYDSSNATAALMAIQYYGKLPINPITCTRGGTHTSNYGSYISRVYSYNGHTFDSPSLAVWGVSDSEFFGGFGYFLQDNPGSSLQRSIRLSEYISDHGLLSSVDESVAGDAGFAKICAEIDAGYPVVVLTSLTTATDGHYITCIGYVQGQYTLIFNDPYGNKGDGYPNANGAGARYDWPGYNNGYQNLNTVSRIIYVRGG